MRLQLPEERQTMLFSATLPNWVSKVARKYQRNPLTVDLVGEDQTGKLNEDVTLNIMQVSAAAHHKRNADRGGAGPSSSSSSSLAL